MEPWDKATSQWHYYTWAYLGLCHVKFTGAGIKIMNKVKTSYISMCDCFHVDMKRAYR